jgi:hypothetical protein
MNRVEFLLADFNKDEPRDTDGKWTTGGNSAKNNDHHLYRNDVLTFDKEHKLVNDQGLWGITIIIALLFQAWLPN